MRTLLAFLAWAMFLAPLPLRAQEAPKGPNCELTQPTEAAGELPVSSQDFDVFARVYPRLTEIFAGYTGCQAIWAESSGLRGKPYFLVIERGEVAGIWPKASDRLCRKGEDTRIGCRDPLMVLMPTYPAGCLQQAKVEGRLSAECAAAFTAESQALQAKRLVQPIKNAL